MTENGNKIECISCKYFHKYSDGGIHCFMKQNVKSYFIACIVIKK